MAVILVFSISYGVLRQTNLQNGGRSVISFSGPVITFDVERKQF